MDLQQLLDARTHSHLRLTETLDTYNDEGVVVASTVTLVEPDGPYEAYVHSDNGVILAGITVPSKFLTDEEFNEIEFDSIEDLKELGGFENHFDDLEDLENLEDLEDHIATVAASIIQPFIDPDTGEPYAWQHEQVDLMTGKPVEWQEDGEELDPFEHLEAVEGYSRTEVFAKDIIDEHIEELKAVLSDIQYDLVQERPQILRRLDAMTDKVKTKLRAIGIVHDAEMACENKPEENQRKTLGWEPLLLERANYDLLTPEGQSRLVKELKLLEDDLKAFMPFLTAPNPEPMLLEVLKQNNYKTLQGALTTYGGLTDSSSPVIILSDLGQDIMREILYQGQMAVLEELYTERKFLRRSIESFGFSRDTHEETQIAAEVLKHLRDYIDNFGADSGEYLLARIMTMTLGDGRLALTRWGKDLVTDIYYNHNI